MGGQERGYTLDRYGKACRKGNANNRVGVYKNAQDLRQNVQEQAIHASLSSTEFYQVALKEKEGGSLKEREGVRLKERGGVSLKERRGVKRELRQEPVELLMDFEVLDSETTIEPPDTLLTVSPVIDSITISEPTEFEQLLLRELQPIE